jgi:hypothetical protein
MQKAPAPQKKRKCCEVRRKADNLHDGKGPPRQQSLRTGKDQGYLVYPQTGANTLCDLPSRRIEVSIHMRKTELQI